MSTKTTLKRIALVAVSALGFGVMSVVPANAAGYTSNITLSTPSLTIVNGGVETSAEAGFFYIDTTNLTGTSSSAAGLQSSGESLLITTTAWPTGGSASDLRFSPVTIADTVASNFAAVSDGVADAATLQIPQGSAAVADFDSNNNSWSATPASNNESNRYWVAVYPGAAVTGDGEYTVRVRLFNGNSATVDKTLKVKFVETIADAGATLSLAKNGNVETSEAYDFTANTSMTATLRDGNSGRVVNGIAVTGEARTAWTPTLNARILTSAGVVEETLDNITDAGVSGDDHLCTATTCADTASDGTGLTGTLSAALLAVGDGVYGVSDADISASASTSSTLSVRITSTSVSASLGIVVTADTGAGNTAAGVDVVASATGLHPDDTVYRDVSSAGAITYNIPTASSTVTLTLDTGAAAGDTFQAKTTWTGNYATASISPADANVSSYTAGTDGKFSLTVTNSSNLDGGTATVVVTGFVDPTTKVTITLEWEDAVPSTISMVDPTPSVFVKLKSTTKWSAVVYDQYNNVLSGVKVQPALSGANNAASATYAAVTSDANGVVEYSVTDAAALADETDSVSFTAIGYSSATASRSITYKATLPVVANMANFFSQTFATLTAAGITTAVPSAGIMDGTSGVTLVIARDQSKTLRNNANTATDDMVAIRVRNTTSAGAAANGAAVTLTAGTGGHVLSASGLPASSRTVAADSVGDAFFQIMATKTGTITFTVTSGTASSTINLVVADQSNAAGRTVSISGAGTGTANGDGVPVTAMIKDRYGNGVANVNLIVTASGVGSIAGGATSQSFTTDANGTYTFLASSSVAAGGSATYSVRASNATDSTSIAGYSGATPVDSTLAAGVQSATHTIVFAAGTAASTVAANNAASAAEAATDAALEAIDAANAATDAANLAAEAADAATVAAEEARDAADAATAAVEALATEVASLIAGLKAQITTLANTVAKIAKKVKA